MIFGLKDWTFLIFRSPRDDFGSILSCQNASKFEFSCEICFFGKVLKTLRLPAKIKVLSSQKRLEKSRKPLKKHVQNDSPAKHLCWDHFGHLWGALGALLGASWPLLRSSWALLGGTCGVLGHLLAALGVLLGTFGLSWMHLGRSWKGSQAICWSIWNDFWSILVDFS